MAELCCMFVGLWELKVWCLMINVMQLYSWCQEMFETIGIQNIFWTFIVLSKQNMESIDQWNQAAISLSEILVAKGNKWASLHYQFINGIEVCLSPEVEEHVEKKWQQWCLLVWNVQKPLKIFVIHWCLDSICFVLDQMFLNFLDLWMAIPDLNAFTYKAVWWMQFNMRL